MHTNNLFLEAPKGAWKLKSVLAVSGDRRRSNLFAVRKLCSIIVSSCAFDFKGENESVA